MPRSPGHGFGPGELLLILDGPGKSRGEREGALARQGHAGTTYLPTPELTPVPPSRRCYYYHYHRPPTAGYLGSDPTFWALDFLICLAGRPVPGLSAGTTITAITTRPPWPPR